MLKHKIAEAWPLLTAKRSLSVARFLYFIGLPYVSLIFGILTPRFFGLRGLEYLTFVDWAGPTPAAQFQQALVLILATWLLDSRTLLLTGLVALLLLGFLRLALARQGVSLYLPLQPAWERLYEAVHWAFYWALLWSITQDLYLGVVFGSILIIVEETIRAKLLNLWPAQQQPFLLKAIPLVLTSTLFFYTPNLWLLLPVYGLMVKIVAPTVTSDL